MFASLLEVCLAIQAFTTCLHYDDLVERLQLYNELAHLAEIYPGRSRSAKVKGQLRSFQITMVQCYPRGRRIRMLRGMQMEVSAAAMTMMLLKLTLFLKKWTLKVLNVIF